MEIDKRKMNQIIKEGIKKRHERTRNIYSENLVRWLSKNHFLFFLIVYNNHSFVIDLKSLRTIECPQGRVGEGGGV